MSRRINVMIDEDTWRFLSRVPSGERSRTINDALRSWVDRRRRHDAVMAMDGLRANLPSATAEEVARWIRQERNRER